MDESSFFLVFFFLKGGLHFELLTSQHDHLGGVAAEASLQRVRVARGFLGAMAHETDAERRLQLIRRRIQSRGDTNSVFSRRRFMKMKAATMTEKKTKTKKTCDECAANTIPPAGRRGEMRAG